MIEKRQALLWKHEELWNHQVQCESQAETETLSKGNEEEAGAH